MSSASDPAKGAQAVTLDSDMHTTGRGPVRGLYVGGTGNVSALMSDGSTETFPSVQAGSVLPISFRRINTSGTTATGLVALY